jgi:hypothetical protein
MQAPRRRRREGKQDARATGGERIRRVFGTAAVIAWSRDFNLTWGKKEKEECRTEGKNRNGQVMAIMIE